MILRVEIDFWSEDVGCFCHEAVLRTLHRVFDKIEIDSVDYSFKKYQNASNFSQLNLDLERGDIIENSSWAEFLRNGPMYRFRLPSGTTGYLKRYAIKFRTSNKTSDEEVLKIKKFLRGLKLGEANFESLD